MSTDLLRADNFILTLSHLQDDEVKGPSWLGEGDVSGWKGNRATNGQIALAGPSGGGSIVKGC